MPQIRERLCVRERIEASFGKMRGQSTLQARSARIQRSGEIVHGGRRLPKAKLADYICGGDESIRAAAAVPQVEYLHSP